MLLYLKFDTNQLIKKLLEEKLRELNCSFRPIAFGEIELLQNPDENQLQLIKTTFAEYGISIIENQKSVLVQKIKDTIIELVFSESEQNTKTSVFLAEKLGHSYGYLSNVFSELTYSSIENFVILQKIEYAKQLILNQKLSLTEIAYRLNYSSVAHLSTQFKNTTGITPSTFQRIIEKRKSLLHKNNL